MLFARDMLHSIAVLLLCSTQFAHAFFEEFFGGGGGGMRMQFGGQEQAKPPPWPRGVSEDISKTMSWLKGTEWRWNNDQWTLKLNKDGVMEAPIQQCQGGTSCRWTAQSGKVYLGLGDAGVFELDAPEQKPANNMKGHRMSGRSLQDRQRLTLTFQKIFDHDAADIDKDLYGALELPVDADDATIKKAYRKLSIKYHPDKNPDEASKVKFAEVRDSYEILNDPDKKILYDTGGMDAVKRSDKGEIQKTEDHTSDLDVTLDQLYLGHQVKASLNRRVVCRGCRTKPDGPNCQGCRKCPNEVRVVNVQMGPFMTQQNQEVPSKEKCKSIQQSIDVNIEKGMKDGDKLTFPRMAEERPGMLPGAVILTLRAGKNAKFQRRNNDLHMNMKVSLREALLGWTQSIQHVDGHIVSLTASDVTKYHQVFKVKGEGMPLRDDPSSFGDLLVKVEVVFPSGKLDDKQREEVSRLFAADPPRPTM